MVGGAQRGVGTGSAGPLYRRPRYRRCRARRHGSPRRGDERPGRRGRSEQSGRCPGCLLTGPLVRSRREHRRGQVSGPPERHQRRTERSVIAHVESNPAERDPQPGPAAGHVIEAGTGGRGLRRLHHHHRLRHPATGHQPASDPIAPATTWPGELRPHLPITSPWFARHGLSESSTTLEVFRSPRTTDG